MKPSKYGEFTVFPKNAKNTKTIKNIKITNIHKHPQIPVTEHWLHFLSQEGGFGVLFDKRNQSR